MKKLMITTMALATLAATPTLAQDYRTRPRAAPMASDSYYRGAGPNYGSYYGAGYDAYASVPDSTTGPQPGVYNYGKYLGWDPDPNIRLQLLRDPFAGD